MTEACEVSLVERLRSVPISYRTCEAIQWAADGTETGHRYTPVGAMMHEAADEICRLRELLESYHLRELLADALEAR